MRLTKYVKRPRLLLELKTPNVLDSFPICTLFLFFYSVFTVKVYSGEVCEVAFGRGWIVPSLLISAYVHVRTYAQSST